MVKFSTTNIPRTRYVVKGIQRVIGSTNAVIPVIAPAHAPAHTNVNASEVTANKTNIGVSSTIYDVAVATQEGQPDPDADLALVYSNGYRYQYLAFKANNGVCDITFQDTTQTIVDPTPTGGITYDVFLPSYTITAAYNGNTVVPPLPTNNTPTNTNPPPSKVPFVPSNINC
jgi:hypothetical protein